MTDTLLAEATQLAKQLYGPDPIDQAALAELEFQIPEPTPPEPEQFEPDPDAALPYQVDAGRVAGFLAERVPEMAREAPDAASTLAQLPREVTAALDDLGAFGSPTTWALLGQIERNAARAGDGAGVELEPDALADHAARYGLRDDLEAIDGVTRFLRALPARVRAGVSFEMSTDPALWELAATLGSRLWTHPLQRQRKH
jgi:hypothetical protein